MPERLEYYVNTSLFQATARTESSEARGIELGMGAVVMIRKRTCERMGYEKWLVRSNSARGSANGNTAPGLSWQQDPSRKTKAQRNPD